MIAQLRRCSFSAVRASTSCARAAGSSTYAVPLRHMEYMMTASLRATATRAFAWHFGSASFSPSLHLVIESRVGHPADLRIPALLMRPSTSIDTPDCSRRPVRPKDAAPSRERRKRVGSPMALEELSAVTGPTPGWPSSADPARRASQTAPPACAKPGTPPTARGAPAAWPESADASSDLARRASAPRSRTRRSRPCGANAERLDRVGQCVFKIQDLALEIAPLAQQQPHPIARFLS